MEIGFNYIKGEYLTAKEESNGIYLYKGDTLRAVFQDWNGFVEIYKSYLLTDLEKMADKFKNKTYSILDLQYLDKLLKIRAIESSWVKPILEGKWR